MSIVPLPAVSPQLAAPAPSLRTARAARDFEASLIASVLSSLEKTFASVPGEDALPGADDYNYLGTQAVAQAVADRGGFGIAALISKSLAAHEGKGKEVMKD